MYNNKNTGFPAYVATFLGFYAFVTNFLSFSNSGFITSGFTTITSAFITLYPNVFIVFCLSTSTPPCF